MHNQNVSISGFGPSLSKKNTGGFTNVIYTSLFLRVKRKNNKTLSHTHKHTYTPHTQMHAVILIISNLLRSLPTSDKLKSKVEEFEPV